jgi:hypothetical protein
MVAKSWKNSSINIDAIRKYQISKNLMLKTIDKFIYRINKNNKVN